MDVDVDETVNNTNGQDAKLTSDVSTRGDIHSIGSDMARTKGRSGMQQNRSVLSEQTISKANNNTPVSNAHSQFKNFQAKWAFETLDRYQKKFCMFNDDVQGTAGVALAGLLGTVRAQGRPLSDFVNQKIVVMRAGSAGLGVTKMAVHAVARMAEASAALKQRKNFT